MKKLFLQDGKLMCGEFPEEPSDNLTEGIDRDAFIKAVAKYDAAVSAAKASAVEVVNGAVMTPEVWYSIKDGVIYDIPKGWTVEIELSCDSHRGCEKAGVYCSEPAGDCRQKKSARLIPLKEQPSGIAAVGIPEYGKGWEGEHQNTIVADGTRIPESVETLPESILQELGEKEVMIDAFDRVSKLFRGREWLMQGRGLYPYNDDRYKEEIRYMMDEFENIKKDTWRNIKTKTFEYREKIIAAYKAKVSPPPQAESQEDLIEEIEEAMERERLAGEEHHPTGYYLGLEAALKIVSESITRKAKP